jgi:tRNA threonylcarbamoyladenosine biosynthesis protein TsaB
MEIAIDTSTDTASIALSSLGVVAAEMSWDAGQNHTVELIPNIITLLEQAEADIGDVEAVMVAGGPGSFNGLRVGFATAKGFALSMDIPLVAVGTLELEAYPHASTGFPVCPVQDVGRGEVAVALYRMDGGEWRQLVEEHVTTVEELCDATGSRTLFCGRFSQRSPGIALRIEELLGDKAVISDNTFCRAGVLAELGYRLLERGRRDDVATVQPLYLRRPAITKPKRGKL